MKAPPCVGPYLLCRSLPIRHEHDETILSARARHLDHEFERPIVPPVVL